MDRAGRKQAIINKIAEGKASCTLLIRDKVSALYGPKTWPAAVTLAMLPLMLEVPHLSVVKSPTYRSC